MSEEKKVWIVPEDSITAYSELQGFQLGHMLHGKYTEEEVMDAQKAYLAKHGADASKNKKKS
jgi:hypothetical protein